MITPLFLDHDQVNANIGWLIANASEPVQYLTHQYLLKADPQSKSMTESWKRVQNSQAALAIHGHNMVKELLMFSETGVNMRLRPIPTLLSWLKGYYRPAEGAFRTQEKPIPVYIRHISAIMKDFAASYGPAYWETIPKVSAGILRYQLYHLIEDDWLTYYLTRIAQNMLNG